MAIASELSVAKTETERARTALLRLQYEQLVGRLIPKEFAQQRIFAFFRSHRDAWLAFPARFAPDVAIALNVTERVAYELLDRLIRQQLDDLVAELDLQPDAANIVADVGGDDGAETRAAADGEPMGGQPPSTKLTRQRRTRKVAD